jgi:hypothetical protein
VSSITSFCTQELVGHRERRLLGARALGDPGAELDGREARLDRVRGPQVAPVLGGEVVERGQVLPVAVELRERLRGSNPYWPYALGTSDYSTLTDWPAGGVVGVHGDFGEPALIPGDPSHGCVRMHDTDLAWLAPRLTLGTPVDIIP